MKKIILLLVLLALCAIALLTAPAIITGVALLFTGTNLVTTAVGLPHMVGVALGLSLLPTTLVLAIKSFSPRFRRLAAIGFLTLAVVYGLCAAAIKHKDDLVPVFKSVMAPVEKWEAARHDKRLAELTSKNESAKEALQSQQQQLQMADAALRAEKAARLHDQQVFLDRLSRQLSDGQNSLKLVTAKMVNPALQSVFEANQRLTEASNALSSAMTNGSLDLPSLQMIVEGAVSNSAKAQIEIQAASAAQETAKLAAKSAFEEKGQDAAQLQKLADERQQAELAARNAAAAAERLQADNVQPHQPDPNAASQTQPEERWSLGLQKRIRHWVGGDSSATVATVKIQNSTGYLLYVTFASSSQQHIWPEQGRAFVAQPGETITVRLAGTPGEGIIYKAWAAQNPYLQWASCDCGPDNRLTPLAIVGQNGDDNPQLLTLVQN